MNIRQIPSLRLGSTRLRAQERVDPCTVRASGAYRADLLDGRFDFETLHGEPNPGHLPLIMCQWQRIDRIRRIVTMLAGQQLDENKLDLYFWNNSDANRSVVDDLLSSAPAVGAVASVNVFHSHYNVGGMGRFYGLRKLRSRQVPGQFAIMLDDDQDVSPRFVADLLARATPRGYAGVWAFELRNSYWRRRELNDGQSANYCGTGGSVIDCAIFEGREFFEQLPDKYWFIEDLWLSHYAMSRGWTLRKVDTPYAFVDDARNQYHTMTRLKAEFYRYLAATDASNDEHGVSRLKGEFYRYLAADHATDDQHAIPRLEEAFFRCLAAAADVQDAIWRFGARCARWLGSWESRRRH